MSDHPRFRQAAILACIVLLLAGCGKRPSTVDAPDDGANSHYPQIYPNINTDPPPR